MVQRGLSVVTPIRDRVDHLRQTLPTWCADPAIDEIVISDFGSDPPLPPDLLGISPKITLVTSGHGEPWNKGLAQNIGIEAAKFNTILKLDCDIYCKNISKYRIKVELGAFVSGYIPIYDGISHQEKQGCFGQVMFKRADGLAIGGYHEFLHGWGFDDQDFYNRLGDNGPPHEFFNLDDIKDIPHDDTVRGGARLADDFPLSLPGNLRREKIFQNTRNKILAGIVPWDAKFARERVLRATGPARFECVLGTRSKLEMRTQLVAAFLSSRFYVGSEQVERELHQILIDERIGDFSRRARSREFQVVDE